MLMANEPAPTGDTLRPDQIEARSFEIISGLLPHVDQSLPQWPILRRVVHATGDPGIVPLMRFHPYAIEAGVRALRSGCPILVDVGMVASGINRPLASALGCEVLCALADPVVAALASERGITRSAAAMHHLSSRLEGAVVAIGNAPTALFALLKAVEEGVGVPVLVAGMPVGFVGAAESKAALVEMGDAMGLPYVTIQGTRGGSPAAVATVNALLRLAVEQM